MAGIPEAGVALIKKFEGLRLEAYPDPLSGGKPYTIGYGSTRTKSGGAFAIGDKISQAEATELLIEQIERDFLPPLEDIPNWSSFNDDQRGAILSFAYNLGARFYGANNFETITRVLRESQWDQIEAALVLYRNRGTSVERGLLRRRLSEAELFLEGVPGEYLSPPGQQFLSGILEDPQQYFDAQADTFEPGERIVSVTRPFMRGDDIAIAQKTLVRNGHNIDADGIFGPASSAALKDFQEKNELPADGILQEATWATLLAPEPDLSLELETELASNLDDLDLDLDLDPEVEPGLVLGLESLDSDLDLDLDLGPDPLAELDPVTESAPATDSNTDLANTIAELPDSGVKLIKTYEFGDTPPEDGADELLLEKIAKVLPPQKKIPNWSTFNDNQRGAIVSFAYDVGTADFYETEGFEALTRVLKDAQWDQLETALVTHRTPDTSAETSLKRRLSEAELFLEEVPGESLSPPGQQFLSEVLTSPQQYFDAQGEKFEVGQRIVSVTRPFMRGDDIATAQKALVKQGYDIDTDGIFGPASKAALEDFQQKSDLTANGILDATTWENLLVAEPITSEPITPEPVTSEPEPDLGTLPVIPIGEPSSEEVVAPEAPSEADLAPAKWILTLQKDTVLKLRPEDVEQLTDAEKQAATAGTTYGLQSYAYADPVLGDFNGHLKVALQDETIKGFNTWFVKGDAVQIVTEEGDVVYPWEEQQATFVLKVFRDT
ncbi:MAG: peptidoglycan-binding protein, partial [Cyanobacteria bacterium P01_G01_bin.38]